MIRQSRKGADGDPEAGGKTRPARSRPHSPAGPPTRSLRGQVHTEATAGPSSSRNPESIFSDDEIEKQFLAEIGCNRRLEWILSKMPWNRIHNIPWVRCEKLGEGGFGSVYVAQRTPDLKLFAVKSMKVNPWPLRMIENKMQYQLAELQMMRRLKYKYIVRCLGCGRSNGSNGLGPDEETLDVFLEYIIRGSLYHVAETRGAPFEEEPYVRQYTYDVLKALQFLEKEKVVHGDIKMDNLLLADDCVKLADWGGAKHLTKKTMKDIVIGTPGFQAPEVEKNRHQDHSSDVYSLGCTVIEMLTLGAPPRDPAPAKKPKDKGYSWLDGWFPEWPDLATSREMQGRVQIPKQLSPMCKDFLRLCLMTRPTARWTASELLLHPFIASRNEDNKLPYQMPLPPPIRASLLTHPDPGHPILPDSMGMTSRVQKHLLEVPKYWHTKPAFGRSSRNQPNAVPLGPRPAPEASPPTKPPSRPGTPAPLPDFQPDFTLQKNSKLINDVVRELLATHTKRSSKLLTPRPRSAGPGASAGPAESAGPAAGIPRVKDLKKILKALDHNLAELMKIMERMNDEVLKDEAAAAARAHSRQNKLVVLGLQAQHQSPGTRPRVGVADQHVGFNLGCGGRNAVDTKGKQKDVVRHSKSKTKLITE